MKRIGAYFFIRRLFVNCPLNQNCHSGPDFHRGKLQPESRVPGENRDPALEMVPDFRRDDVWMPPYQLRGRLLKSGMTENAVLWTDTI